MHWQGTGGYPKFDPSLGISIRVGLNGYAQLNGNSFVYQDRWSDPISWPGGFLPLEGDDVLIPENQLVLLDVSPPSLARLRVYGQLTISDDLVSTCLADSKDHREAPPAVKSSPSVSL